ncbi:MAG: Hsp20/alpha crystallin family protein [Thermoanaerobaculia bacterium]
MAVTQTDSEQARSTAPQSQPKQSGKEGGEQRSIARSNSTAFLSPFSLLQRFFVDDIGQLFDERGIGTASRTQPRDGGMDRPTWDPKIDVIQRGNDLIVRTDLPGIKPDDVVVEISDDVITISGERHQEKEEDRGSVYRFERTYGAFFREIPLPEGAIVDQAKASFKDGVLEITVPAPSAQVARGRRIEISHGDVANNTTATQETAPARNQS